MNQNAVLKAQEMIEIMVSAIESVKGEDIEVIDARHCSTMFESVVIASGRSDRQVKSLARRIYSDLRENKVEVIGVEGLETGSWVLVDAGIVVAHVMQPEIRQFYQLEDLWKAGQPVVQINPETLVESE